ncbi:MAG: transposase, IS4 family protein [Parcubacteria group bacterium Greene0416_79]|nr:MAG: transposase, IS4 family protein [Parcubacteria group bacterium Greene0416_79]
MHYSTTIFGQVSAFLSKYHFDAVVGPHEKPAHHRCLADEKIRIGEFANSEDYPDALRRVTWKDEETGEIYRFITNNFTLSAEQVALIYKNRWQIELFFKWIKQNLKIKSFLGTSRNAVRSQIWVAMIFFLLMCYIKFQTRFKGSLLELTRMIRETLMIRRQIIDLLSLNTKTLKRLKPPDFPQMSLWV